MVPWADFLTDIAAKYVIAKGGTKITRDGFPRLDGPVGDAALRIEVEGANEGVGWAVGEAASAVAAGGGLGLKLRLRS